MQEGCQERLRPERGAKPPSESEREPSAAVERDARDGKRLGVGPQAYQEGWGPASSEKCRRNPSSSGV
jgi:hypothetical protein